jgi:hypothetical protein
VDIRVLHVLADRKVPYLKLGSHRRLQNEDRVHDSPISMERSTQDSGRVHSAITSSGGSSGRSHHHKSKKTKIVKNEE